MAYTNNDYDNTNPLGSTTFKEGVVELNSDHFLARPDVARAIFPHLREETNLVDFFWDSGKKAKTGQSTFHWYEERPLMPVCQVKAVSGTPGAGNAVTITIEALNAQKTVPFVKYEIWQIGGVQGIIKQAADITPNTTTGEHQVKLYPVDSTQDIVAASAVTEFMILITAAKADGSKQTTGKFNQPVKFSGQTQIIPSRYTTFGSAAANESEIIMTKSGSKYMYRRGVEKAFVEHKIKMAQALLMGQESNGLTNLTGEGGDTTIRTTKGMLEVIKDGGQNPTGAAFDLDEMKEVNRILDKEGAPSQYFVACGNLAKEAVDDFIFGKGTAGTYGTPSFAIFAGSNYTTWGSSDPKQRSIDIGVDGIRLGSRDFYFKKEVALSYKNGLGAPGLPYPDYLIFLPQEKKVSGENGESLDLCMVRYKASDKENRAIRTNIIDGKTVDGEDAFHFDQISEIGWQQAMAHWAVLWKKDTSSSVV